MTLSNKFEEESTQSGVQIRSGNLHGNKTVQIYGENWRYNLGNTYIPSENKQGISNFRIIRFIKVRAFLKSTSNLHSFATKRVLLSLSIQKWQAKESYYPLVQFRRHFFAFFNKG